MLKVPRLGAKAFEQCAGFIRVPESDNILDNTAVHPERYALVVRMAADNGRKVSELVADPEILNDIDLSLYESDGIGLPTLNDIIGELRKPGRDPRQKAAEFRFDDNVREIEDLCEGMVLPGIVNNITDFGAFVDIGLHESGLVHISQVSDRRVRSASEVLSLHQHVFVKVISVDLDRRRIGLSMRGVDQSGID